MKKVFLYLIAAAAVAACNNSKAPEATASATPVKESTEAASKPSAPSGAGCSSILWFKEGATLSFNLTDASGKVTGSTATHIDKVYSDGPAMVADFTNTSGSGKAIKASYRCQGDKLFMDMQSMLQNNFAGLKKSGMEVEVSNAFISFPSNMKPGDVLEDASCEIKTKKAGKEFMTMTSAMKNRKVEGVEKITTPAGSWDCIRLSQVQSTNTRMMGKEIMGTDSKMIMWFSPAAGPVKFEMYDASNKLAMRSELVSIK